MCLGGIRQKFEWVWWFLGMSLFEVGFGFGWFATLTLFLVVYVLSLTICRFWEFVVLGFVSFVWWGVTVFVVVAFGFEWVGDLGAFFC